MNFLFDLYGTLIDIKTDENDRAPWEIACTFLGLDKSAWQQVQLECAALCRTRITSPEHEIQLLDVFCDLLKNHGKDAANAAELAWQFRRASTQKLRLFDGAREMLTALHKAGAGVYLLSNAQSCFTMPELELLELLPHFDGIVISSDAGVKKPAKAIFNLALSRFSLSANDCIYVGNDMRDDVLGATGAGLKTVYIHTEQSGSYDIEIPDPTYVARDHRHLTELLLDIATK
ncbi:MAG: HAD family hydrolase [Clostridia bacterium]|nr:HAD family hydrolase [Clostridia bacterium]